MSDPMRLIVLALDGQRYGLALEAVERVLPMLAISPLPGAPSVALGVIAVAGSVLPVVDLRARLGLLPRAYGLSARLLVARTRRRRLAIPADEVTGLQDVDAEAVSRPETVLLGTGPVRGVARLDDGLIFIHDPEAFLSLEEGEGLERALAGSGR